jgi:glucose/arabinose dehydrogenase
MRLMPSRRVAWVLAGIAAVVLVTFPLWRGAATDLYEQVRDQRLYDQAEDRTSAPAPAGDAVPLPGPSDPSGATGGDPSIAVEPVADLVAPSAVADPPGPGPVLVTTLDGTVRALDVATGDVEVVLDLTSIVSTGMERGLLGAAVDPEGERLYLNYTDLDGDTEVASWPLDGGRPTGGADDGVLHLAVGQPFPNHNGGNLVFGPDGALWIGTGDGGSGGDPGDVAQDTGSLLGKMLRIVPLPDGGAEAPTTNPDWGGRPEIWGIGLRNPWRYSFDRHTDRLWIADVGQDVAEEVSVVDGDHERPNFGCGPTSAGTRWRGTSPSTASPPTTSWRRSSRTGTTTAAPSRVATCTGAPPSPTSMAGTCSPTTAAAGSGRCRPTTRGRSRSSCCRGSVR